MLRFSSTCLCQDLKKWLAAMVEKGTGVLARSAFLDVPFGFLGFYATMLLSV